MSLRDSLIKLAHEVPSLRKHLIPLLRTAGVSIPPDFTKLRLVFDEVYPGGYQKRASLDKRAFIKLALRTEAFKHIMEQGGNLGILSAYGGDDRKGEDKRTKSENKERHGQLLADLQKMGYHKMETMKGSWEGVAEKAVMVPNMKPEDLFSLGRKYKQDSVIYKSKDGVVGMYYPASKKAEVAVDPKGDPAYSMAKDKSEYSKVHRNWSFTFGFLWGKDIPWDGHSVISHEDVQKHLGIGKGKKVDGIALNIKD